MKSFIYRIFSEKRYIFTHMGTLKLGIIAQKSRRLRPQERSVFENFTWQQHQLHATMFRSAAVDFVRVVTDLSSI